MVRRKPTALSVRPERNAEASGEVVREAVAAMSQIEKSSEQISQIIGVIDEIAFQTNLLALNAGVEAARAGDAGKGFAVVASEVRALAQRSSDAAKEIKTLISASSQHVETGVGLVGRAGDALEDIASKVVEISELVSTISSSTQEQATALKEVNVAMNQMDQVTQQNAAMVEEIHRGESLTIARGTRIVAPHAAIPNRPSGQHCDKCASTKSQNRGLSHHQSRASPNSKSEWQISQPRKAMPHSASILRLMMTGTSFNHYFPFRVLP